MTKPYQKNDLERILEKVPGNQPQVFREQIEAFILRVYGGSSGDRKTHL